MLAFHATTEAPRLCLSSLPRVDLLGGVAAARWFLLRLTRYHEAKASKTRIAPPPTTTAITTPMLGPELLEVVVREVLPLLGGISFGFGLRTHVAFVPGSTWNGGEVTIRPFCISFP